MILLQKFEIELNFSQEWKVRVKLQVWDVITSMMECCLSAIIHNFIVGPQVGIFVYCVDTPHSNTSSTLTSLRDFDNKEKQNMTFGCRTNIN